MIKTIIRGFKKLILDPFRYKKKDDYNAEQYWSDRLQKHRTSFRGVGHEGKSESFNQQDYEKAGEQVIKILRNYLKVKSPRILEIGAGNGFYTKKMRSLNPSYQEAIDITDVNFDSIRSAVPSVQLSKLDVSSDAIDGQFDIVTIIDVIEHIVNDRKFAYTMRNIGEAIAPGGILLITGYGEKEKKHLYYVKTWSKDQVVECLGGLQIIAEQPFRKTNLMVLKNPA